MNEKKSPEKNNWFNKSDRRFVWTPDRLKEVAESLNSWVDRGIETKKNFIFGDWCFESGFLPGYFSIYRERCIELEDAYQRAKAWQAHCISKGALFNELNVKAASMWLANHHKNEGWTIFKNASPLIDELTNQIKDINTNMAKAYERLDKKE